MVIDHINLLWFDRSDFTLSLLGRAAFPLFAYAVAAGAMRKSKHYVWRLFLLALISQPFFMWATGEMEGNVVFTLAAGAAVAQWAVKAQTWQVLTLAILSLPATLVPEVASFGYAGIMLPALIVLAFQKRNVAYPVIIALLFFLNASDLRENGLLPAFWIVQAQLAFAAALLPLMIVRAAQAFPGRERVLGRYILHIFYPAHLVVLKLIQGVFG